MLANGHQYIKKRDLANGIESYECTKCTHAHAPTHTRSHIHTRKLTNKVQYGIILWVNGKYVKTQSHFQGCRSRWAMDAGPCETLMNMGCGSQIP